MKVYAVSDLHGNLDGLDPCDADLVVIAGDLAPMKGWGVWHVNDQVKWINRKFSAWCGKYPKTEFVVIPGNHDLFAQRDAIPAFRQPRAVRDDRPRETEAGILRTHTHGRSPCP